MPYHVISSFLICRRTKLPKFLVFANEPTHYSLSHKLLITFDYCVVNTMILLLVMLINTRHSTPQYKEGSDHSDVLWLRYRQTGRVLFIASISFVANSGFSYIFNLDALLFWYDLLNGILVHWILLNNQIDRSSYARI